MSACIFVHTLRVCCIYIRRGFVLLVQSNRQCESQGYAGQVTLEPAFLCLYLYETMANWQDIRALEERIYDAVQEYLDNPDAYTQPVLHVYLDQDEMLHKAEAEDNMSDNTDDGIYPMVELIRTGDDGLEPDVDKISDIANSWIFLD